MRMLGTQQELGLTGLNAKTKKNNIEIGTWCAQSSIIHLNLNHFFLGYYIFEISCPDWNSSAPLKFEVPNSVSTDSNLLVFGLGQGTICACSLALSQ